MFSKKAAGQRIQPIYSEFLQCLYLDFINWKLFLAGFERSNKNGTMELWCLTFQQNYERKEHSFPV